MASCNAVFWDSEKAQPDGAKDIMLRVDYKGPCTEIRASLVGIELDDGGANLTRRPGQLHHILAPKS
jgi:hypothetical protein